MKCSLVVFELLILAAPAVTLAAKPQVSKSHEVLRLYEKIVSVHQKLEQLQSRSQQLQKDVDMFLGSESEVQRLIGLGMLLGALRAWVPEIKDSVAEEDFLITQLVKASTGPTGEAARHADEGVRLLREQQVYRQQSTTRAEALIDGMTETLRSVREESLANLPALLEQQQFDAQLKAIDDLDQKQELTFARAKDAFSRLKAASK